MMMADALDAFCSFASARGVTMERLTAAEEAAIIATLHWPPEAALDPTVFFFQRAHTAHLTAAGAIALMVAFYADVRADDCDVDADRDMLLFQWGAYDRGDAETYEYSITRQMIPGGQQDVIGQLALTLTYPPSDALRYIGHGNRWCPRPAALGDFLAFVRECEATTHVDKLVPQAARVTFENAE